MPEPRPSNTALLSQIKSVLLQAGLEIFRARGDEILLAERPRDNLILDSGVRLYAGDPLESRVVLRAQKADFPNEDERHLFERVRVLATPAVAQGFVEVTAEATRIEDPGDPARTLDVFYEITFSKKAPDLGSALEDLKFALSLEKRA